MKDFVFKMPSKILFGVGVSGDLSELCREFSTGTVMVVTDKVIGKTAGFLQMLEGLKKHDIVYQVYDDTVPEPPVEAVDRAAEILRSSGCGLVIAVGGGSAIDSAKAMCMLSTNPGSVRDYLFGGCRTIENRPLPLVCVPTTAGSGSEVTASSVISDVQRGIKLSVTHDWIVPLAAVIDPVMHKDMPPLITASTGMDALTHAIEAYVSKNAEPISDALALSAIRLIGENIRRATHDPGCMEARSNMALASLMAAAAFVNAGLGAVHGISQAIGGVAHVSHGISNSLLLPYVCQANLAGNMERFAIAANLLGENTEGMPLYEAAERCVKAIDQLLKDLRLPTTLQQVKVEKEMFPEIVKGALEYRLMPLNPVVLEEADIYRILEQAY